jgi:hypothetical protein
VALAARAPCTARTSGLSRTFLATKRTRGRNNRPSALKKRRGRLKAIKAFGTIEFDPKFSYQRARAKR